MKYIKQLCLIVFYLFVLSVVVSNAQNNIVHIVEQGETVFSISKKYGITQQQLYDLNPWAKESLRVGGKLLLPNVSAKNMSDNNIYIIKNGDTMYSVCKKYGITEESLMAANKGLSSDKFPAGRGIVIPSKDFVPDVYSNKKNEISKTQPINNDFIKITLALPFLKNSKYVEFYRGFLMGINEEKMKGISIDLNVVDLSSSDIDYNNFKGRDIVIGGVSYQEISNIKDVVNHGYYVVPFSSDSHISELGDNIIKINNHDSYTDEIALQLFISNYKNKNIYFVDDYSSLESQFSKKLKIILTNQNKTYKVIDLTGDIPKIEPNSILVPISKDEKLLADIFDKIPESSNYRLFGYPLWQSFSKNLISNMHKYNAQIYTPFYFDSQKSNSVIFANKFSAWYGHKLSNSYPQFGVMGYEMAKYFIETYYKSKNILGPLSDFEPLQMNINIQKTDKGYENKSLFFVSFNTDGSTSIITL